MGRVLLKKLFALTSFILISFQLLAQKEVIVSIDSTSCVTNIINGGFEHNAGMLGENSVPGWQTTASDNIIEIWNTPSIAYEGNHLAELNAYMVAALYQDITTIPGDTLNFSFAHKGRVNPGPDVMTLRIGPVGGALTLIGTYSDTPANWGVYTGTYVVPAGQTNTRFQFNSVSSSGGPTFGNLLDDVRFAPKVPYQAKITSNCGNTAEVEIRNIDPVNNLEFSFDGGTTFGNDTTLLTADDNVSIVIRNNDNGCEYYGSYAIEQIASFSITVDAVRHIDCFENNTGEILTTINGGTAPFTYTWTDNVSNTDDALGLDSGFYQLSVTDSINCTEDTTIQIIKSPQPTLSMSISPVECFGENTGKAYVTPLTGTPPFSYEWNNDSNLNEDSLINQPIGTYTVEMTDDNGCVVIDSITISEPSELTIDALTISEIDCHDNCNGSIDINASGATPPYQYEVSGQGTQANSLFENLCSNTYTITVTDDNNCTASKDTTMSNPALLVVTLSNDTIICAGGSAIVTSNVVGGNTPYQYLWNDNSTQPSNTVAPNATSEISILVTDANNCEARDTNTVFVSDIQVSLSSIDNAVCFGSATGEVSVNGTNGYTPYVFSNLDGSENNNSGVFSALTNGTYQFSVTDSIGCSDTLTAEVNEPLPLQIDSILTTEVNCNDGCDGAVSIYLNGGTLPYSYEISGLPAQNSETFTGLCSGNYSITITDSNNCQLDTSATINNQALLTVDVLPSDTIICAGDSITLNTSVSGGVQPYNYVWSNADVTSTSIVKPDSTSTFTVTVTDANNCSTVDFSIVNVSRLSMAIESISHAKCFNTNTGNIQLSASNGYTPYFYSLESDNSNNGIFNDLFANDYTAFVSDSIGCTDSINFTITEPEKLKFDSIATQGILCHTDCNGSLSTFISGGTLPYIYNLEQQQQNSNAFNNLCAGTYALEVSDSNSCSIDTTLTIDDVEALIAQFDADKFICENDSTELMATVTGGTQPYNYLWNTNQERNAIFVAPNATSTYTIQVTDQNNCDTSATITVNVSNLSAQASVSNELDCFGDNDASINAIGSNGFTPYSYRLQPENDANNSGNFTDLSAGTKQIVITDSLNCTDTIEITIDEPEKLVIDATGIAIDNALCNEPVGSIYGLEIDGGTEDFSYKWTSSNGDSYDSKDIDELLPGTYELIVTDANGCEESFSYTIEKYEMPIADFSVTPDSGKAPLSSQFSDNSSTSHEPLEYEWSFGEGSESDLTNPLFVYETPGKFYPKLKVTDANGCSDESDNEVVIYVISEIEIPNTFTPQVFTPNRDGFNDEFRVQQKFVADFHMEIYNRWGNLVHVSNSLANGWDGRSETGDDAPEGSYFYIVTYRKLDTNTTEQKTGYISLIR